MGLRKPDALVHQFGLIVYAVPFGLAGVFGVVEIVFQRLLAASSGLRAIAHRMAAPARLTERAAPALPPVVLPEPVAEVS